MTIFLKLCTVRIKKNRLHCDETYPWFLHRFWKMFPNLNLHTWTYSPPVSSQQHPMPHPCIPAIANKPLLPIRLVTIVILTQVMIQLLHWQCHLPIQALTTSPRNPWCNLRLLSIRIEIYYLLNSRFLASCA